MSVDAIAFGQSLSGRNSVEESQFLRAVAWRKSGDRKLAAAARAVDEARFCRAWRRLVKRFRDGAVARKRSPIVALPRLLQPVWSRNAWEDVATSDPLCELLFDLHRRKSRRRSERQRKTAMSRRVTECLAQSASDVSPWTLLVGMTVLTEAAEVIDDDTLLSVWRHTLGGVVGELAVIEGEAPGDPIDIADDRHLLLAGELPWTAGVVFSDVKGAGRMRRTGRKVLRRHLEAITDGDGTPHARLLLRLPLTIAVFTRAMSLSTITGERLLDAESADRFELLVSRAAAMAQLDGTLALSNGASFGTGSLLRTASTLPGLLDSDPSRGRLQRIHGDLPVPNGRRESAHSRLPKVKRTRRQATKDLPSSQSDWAELACLRNNWSAGGDSCVIAYHRVNPQLSITAFERPLIDGDWHLGVEIDETPVEIAAGWTCVCWFSDHDADYLELQQDTSRGVRLLRQVLLSRTDHWLYLADNVGLAGQDHSEPANIKLVSRLPLADGVKGRDNRWTRDVKLRTDRLQACAYPLTLPQERIDRADGALEVHDGVLVISQEATGSGLHSSLVLDWSPDRRRMAAEWRQLTVAEDGTRLRPEKACGQRLRIGRHQWLFYRSLQPSAMGRSVLGHHTSHETVIGEFTSWGEVEPIVLVEW